MHTNCTRPSPQPLAAMNSSAPQCHPSTHAASVGATSNDGPRFGRVTQLGVLPRVRRPTAEALVNQPTNQPSPCAPPFTPRASRPISGRRSREAQTASLQGLGGWIDHTVAPRSATRFRPRQSGGELDQRAGARFRVMIARSG
ncbi:hypothetical protein C8Q78DRAFT_380438 [Trametes maxima]|nr:hypothetical protein C8Q78DRAFT_380438 [Trametes maxima]